MHTLKTRWILVAGAIAATAAVLLLWSWNTVAELFGGPTAELKHAIAALVFVGIARVVLSSTRGLHRGVPNCPRQAIDR